jgi:hypothetical protein
VEIEILDSTMGRSDLKIKYHEFGLANNILYTQSHVLTNGVIVLIIYYLSKKVNEK